MRISISEIYDSLQKSGKIPAGWKPDRSGVRKVAAKNKEILEELKKHLPKIDKRVITTPIKATYS